MHTGGYPINDDSTLTPPNETFPIIQRDWRGSTEHCQLVDTFFDSGKSEYFMTSVRSVAACGDRNINQYGSLRRALRASHESWGKLEEHLSHQAHTHLHDAPELREDLMELRRLGATPRYHGTSPGVHRIRGLPRNKSEQDFTMQKLWSYVGQGKCSCAPHLL